jgi:Methyltransferase domain
MQYMHIVGVNNMHNLRKEISESYSILHAIKQQVGRIQSDDILMHDDCRNEQQLMIVIDLCAGKCLTTTLLRILYPNGTYLAIDKLPQHKIPYCRPMTENDDITTNSKNRNQWYWCCNIMDRQFMNKLQQTIDRYIAEMMEKQMNDNAPSLPVRRPITLLVGMHLCGNLSYRAIELFQTIRSIDILLLCPCCLPKRHHLIVGHGDPYDDWVNHLVSNIMVNHTDNIHHDDHEKLTYCQVTQDMHMNTNKNSIIIASRRATR